MSNNLLLAAVIGAAVFIVVKKQGQAAVLKQPAQTSPVITTNMNGDMWTRLLGKGFVSVAGSGTASGIMKNLFGQLSTSDGKPIGGSDPLAGFIPVNVGAPSNGVDYLGSTFPGTSILMDWKGTAAPEDIYYSDDLAGLF